MRWGFCAAPAVHCAHGLIVHRRIDAAHAATTSARHTVVRRDTWTSRRSRLLVRVSATVGGRGGRVHKPSWLRLSKGGFCQERGKARSLRSQSEVSYVGTVGRRWVLGWQVTHGSRIDARRGSSARVVRDQGMRLSDRGSAAQCASALYVDGVSVGL